MKLDYDIEINILKDIHDLDSKECLIISDKECSENYYTVVKIIDDILGEKYLKKWTDNTKSQFPPDFINEEDSLIMEVMRIDNHSVDGKINPNLAKQREMIKEIEKIRDVFPGAERIITNAVTDLPTNEDHNYVNYYTSFQRTIRKHLSKLKKYKNNYPNKKVIFLVADETSGIYFEAITKTDFISYGRPHLVFQDKRFVSEFINSELDYLLFYSPYNYFETIEEHLQLPQLIVFDVKHMKDNKDFTIIDYDETRMISNEK